MSSVVIYARHSSDKQTTSTQDQIERCKKYCVNSGYHIIKIFSDEAVSGAIDMKRRQGIYALIDHALTGNVEKIVCEDLSRLSRNQGDIAHFYQKMAFLDVEIETIHEGIINELHIGLKGTMNALYLKDLADKTYRGMIASVLKGGVPGGRTYGYDKVETIKQGEVVRGVRKINLEQAEIIKRIFSQYLDGLSTHSICQELNLDGIPSPKGGQWHPSSLLGTRKRATGILRQTLYKGEITFNRLRYKKHPKTGKKVAIVRPVNEWIRVPIPELAIISEETFEKVQKAVKQRSQQRQNQNDEAAARSENECKQNNRAYIRKWRARQAKPTNGHTQYITTRRLHCAHCNETIAAYKAMADRCKNRTCLHHQSLKREDTLTGVLSVLQAFGDKDISAFNKISTSALQHNLKTAMDELDGKREEIRNLLQAFGKQKKGSETLLYIADLEAQCSRKRFETQKIENQLSKLTPLNIRERKGIIRSFHELLRQYNLNPTNEQIVRQLQSYILRIHVQKKTKFTIEYDLQKIVEDFR